MPPKRVDSFDFYEFSVVIAESGGSYIAIGYDKSRIEVGRAHNDDLDEAKEDIRRQLAEKSNEFVGYAGAINLFRKAFPEGFNDPFFIYDERTYKVKSHEKALATLSEEQLRARLAENDFKGIADAARRTFTNLVFPNEIMAFGTASEQPDIAKNFSAGLLELLYGDFDRAFDELVSLLAPEGAAKWTVLTYWPFMLFPSQHMFLKPEVAQESARRLADDFGYESRPSARVYRRYLSFVGRMRDGIAELTPRDNIDVQTFMYVIGNRDFMHKAVERREEWLDKSRR